MVWVELDLRVNNYRARRKGDVTRLVRCTFLSSDARLDELTGLRISRGSRGIAPLLLLSWFASQMMQRAAWGTFTNLNNMGTVKTTELGKNKINI